MGFLDFWKKKLIKFRGNCLFGDELCRTDNWESSDRLPVNLD